VTVIVTGRNSATTIEPCLEGLTSQAWPIREIIVFDNGSTDDSVARVEAFAARSPVPVRLERRTSMCGICESYNDGARMAATPLLVLVHSDGAFPSPNELDKLVKPLLEDDDVAASYPGILMPRENWELFPFWQKCNFARDIGRVSFSMCGLFDCVRKSVYLESGGYNARRFTMTCGYGGEDSDARFRIAKLGRTVKTDARVIHLHDLSGNYGLGTFFLRRKLLARTYGKILRFQGLFPVGMKILFFVKPALAALPFVFPPWTLLPGLILQILFSLVSSWSMYTSRSTLADPHILSLPFVDIALIYYETFWFFEGWATPAADERKM
jgi:glycosyltransferase involved in cell wall biosynthesis